ncbi:MAG: hypothetical protein AAF267_25465, partial [Deinococcota bacterium]
GDMFPDWRGDLLVGALKFRLLSRLDVEDGRVRGEELRLNVKRVWEWMKPSTTIWNVERITTMIKALRFAMQHWTTLLIAIEFVEAFSDDDTPGEQKKMMVLDALLDMLEKVKVRPNKITMMMLSKAIDMLVSLLDAVDWGDKIEAWLTDDDDETVKAALKRKAVQWEPGITVTG